MTRRLVPLFLALPACLSMAAETKLELRTSPLIDLYYDVRAQAADVTAEPEPGFEAAVDAARAIQRQLGSFGGWGPLDSRVFTVEDVSELIEGFGDRESSIRDDAVRMATAIDALMPAFLEDPWPERKAELERRIAALREEFLPRHGEALAFMMRSLAVPDPGLTVPVYLVSATNPPGAMTYRLWGGGPAVVIDVRVGETESLLRETMLHESCHALDAASRDGGSAFATLRALLEERGVSRRDRAYHEVPHTLMFVQAEETMRRLIDPEHVAYGDASDLYRRTGVIADVERKVWRRHLDGEIDRETALRSIVDTLYPARPWLGGIASPGALERIRSLRATADVEVSDGTSFTTIAVYEGPRRAAFRTTDGERTLTMGLDGDALWVYQGDEPGEAGPFVREFVLGHQFLAQVLFFDRLYPDHGPPQPSSFDELPCSRVAAGEEGSFRALYYEPQGRPLGMRMHHGAETRITIRFGDWREVDGVTLPFLVSIDDGRATFDYRYSEVRLNRGSVDDFRAP